RLQRGLPRAISGRGGSITRPHSGIREPCWIGGQSGTLDRARPIYRERADGHLGFRAPGGDRMGERPSVPNRKPWLGTAAGPGPSGHNLALEPVWSSSVPPWGTLLGFQRIAPSQGPVCSALGSAFCQLPARSRFSSRDPRLGKTGGRQFRSKSCSKNRIGLVCFG